MFGDSVNKTKKIALGSSVILALASPLYAQPQDSSEESETPKLEVIVEKGPSEIEQKINDLEQNIEKRFEKLGKEHSSVNREIKEINAKMDKISEPHWYSGPIGYVLAMFVGIIGVFGYSYFYDFFKKRKITEAYNRTAEKYFENGEFDSAILSLENSLVVDPNNRETMYSLIDALIRKENDLRENRALDTDTEKELSEIRKNTYMRIDMLKEYDRKDFIPYMFEGHRLYFNGKRETDPIKRKGKFVQAFKKYGEAIEKYKSKKLVRYLTEIKARRFKRKHSRLNVLYRKLGSISMEEKDYKEAIGNLETALVYDMDDKKTFALINKCKEGLKTQNLNSLKTPVSKGEKDE